MYRTHKAGGALAMVVAFEAMRKHGMLIPDINPYIQLLVMYPASSWGSTAPDLDHHWGSVKEKTPFNMLVHKILHLTEPAHRSWQTHSILVTGGLCALLYSLVMWGDKIWGTGSLGSFDWIIIRLVTVGFLVGVASHLFLDCMSTAGIWSHPGGFKIRIVPHSSFFATDSKWETFVFYASITATVLMVINIGLGYYDTSLLAQAMKLKTIWE